MDAPGNGREPERDPLERLVDLLGPRLEELRSALGDAGSRWRGERVRAGEGTRHRLQELARDLGLVTREDWDELELRVAQLEHRLKLLEDRAE
jgi:polyhydroxyalkanoate synthesis regulator phasin